MTVAEGGETAHTVRRFATSPEGVYGLVIVAGLIVVARDTPNGAGRTVLAVGATLIVFFVVHVYAAAVARLSAHDGDTAAAVRHSVHESLPLLVMGAVPLGVLALGLLGPFAHTDAAWAALIVDALLLGIVGWFLTARRTRGAWRRLGGAAVTAALGVLMIFLKALLH